MTSILEIETEKFEELIKCAICLLEYDEEIRKPKCLPCSHTLCFPCINGISQACSPNREQRFGQGRGRTIPILIGFPNDTPRLAMPDTMPELVQVLQCPFCRHEFRTKNLPNNAYVLEMLKAKKPTEISTQISNVLEESICSLANILRSHKEIDDDLKKSLASISLTGEKISNLIERNNSSLPQMIISLLQHLKSSSSCRMPILKFLVNDVTKFIFRIFQAGRLKGEVHIRPAITFYPEFVQKLGEFCYRSPKEFSRSVDKAKAGVFIFFSFSNPDFVPSVKSITDNMDNWENPASDVDEVGVSCIKALGDKIIDWSFVFILDKKENLQSHTNLPQPVKDNELFGRVINHHTLEPLLRLSLLSKADRSDCVITLESQ